MAVTLNARASDNAGAINVALLDLTTLTVAEGPETVLLALSIYENPDITITGINWDQAGTPQALTFIDRIDLGAGATGLSCELWGLKAPTTGNRTLRWTAGNSVDVILYALAFDGVDQSGGPVAWAQNVNTNTGTGLTASLAITSAAGEYTVTVLGIKGAVPSAPTQTPEFTETTLADIDGAGSSAEGAASVTHQWTLGASVDWAMIGCTIVAAEAAAVAPRPRYIGI